MGNLDDRDDGAGDNADVEKQRQFKGVFAYHPPVILVVEDDHAVLESTVMVLERRGYRTIIATDGAKAVSVYERNKNVVNAVLLDMMMPVMQSDKTLEALRKINPNVKVVVATGFAMEDCYERSIEKAQAFLEKPYTIRELLATLHKVLTT